VNLSWNDVAKLSGSDLAVPLIKDSGEVELIAKLKRGHAPIGTLVRVYEGDIHQTKHAKYMSDTKKNRLLVVGTHVSHFHIDLSTGATKKRWFNYTKEHTFEMNERLVIQGIANMGQRIRIKGSIIPEGVVVGNSANCIELVSSTSSYEYFLGILSSDAVALASADLSIAMGTDTAIATADIVVMRRDLGSVVEALNLSSKTLRIIRGNLAWAFLYNIIGIPVAAMGALQPMCATGAMAFSSVFVVTNSLRIK
jgi:hypothetical protein